MSITLNDTRLDSSSPVGGFSILNYLDQLTPDEGKHGSNDCSYYCPVCNAKNFKVNTNTGKYYTFECSCANSEDGKRAIRNAVAPLEMDKGANSTRRVQRKPKKKSDREKNQDARKKVGQIGAEIDHYAIQVIEGNIPLDEAEIGLSAWCKEHESNDFLATKSLRERVKEKAQDNSVIEDRDLEKLEAIQSQRKLSETCRVTDLLPESLSAAIEHDAAVLNVQALAFAIYLLPLAGSLLPSITRLVVDAIREPPIIWGCCVGTSGSGKTRILTTIIKDINRRERQAYEQSKTISQTCDQAGKSKTDGNIKPQEPCSRKRFRLGVATPEAMTKVLGQKSEKGICLVQDELRGTFDGLNQYRGGKGDGESILIAMWDGNETPVDRIDKSKSFYAFPNNFCIAGGMQPGVFTKAFNDPEDSQGMTARFLFFKIPAYPPRRIKGTLDLPDLLPGIYDHLLQFPCENVRLSTEADDFLTTAIEESKKLFNSDFPAITAWARKLTAHLLRVTLVLHALAWASAPSTIDPEVVSIQTIKAAHKFLMVCHESFSSVTYEVRNVVDMATLMDRVLTTARQAGEGGVSIRDLYSKGVAAIRSQAKLLDISPKDLALDICQRLTKEGFGKLDESRKGSFIFTAYSDADESC